MTAITRIDPDLPLCWEDPTTVRIGFDRAIARVRNPSAAMQRLIGALLSGVATHRLSSEARRVGATPAETRAVLEALRPALVEEHSRRPHPAKSPPPLRTVISDDGRAAPGLREGIGACSVFDLDAATPTAGCDLVVHVERFLEPLERVQHWRAAGIPHLLVRYTDQAVLVGPVVEPDGSPCHSCASLSLVADDAALPVLSIQLTGRVPQSESLCAGEFAGIYAALLARDWQAGSRAAHRSRWRIPVHRGRPAGSAQLETIAPHPECRCNDPLEAEFCASPMNEVSR